MIDHQKGRELQPGDTLGGRYRIARTIGEGGMGRVFLADDLRLKGQQWAVKWIPRDESDPGQPEKEAQMMTSLQHPSLPRIIDYIPLNEADGCCLVMDYLEGETLLQRSASSGHRLPWPVVVRYAAQICDLLYYLHSLESPIVFRDMKPSNVIVGHDEHVRLVDFGIARTYKAGKAQDTVHVGSVGFAAPELMAKRQTDPRADLYSLGCLMYFLLSGGQFYNFSKLPIEHVTEEVPSELATVLRMLLAADPAQRYPNARAAKEALLNIEGNQASNDLPKPSVLMLSNKRTIVSVYGLFPGVGATFIAAALAKLIAAGNVRVVFHEFPWQQADSFLSMLDAANGGTGTWQERSLNWRVTGDREANSEPEFESSALYKLLFETKGEVLIFDVSSSAEGSAVDLMIRSSDYVVAVAAPDPAGLRMSRTVENWERLHTAPEKERIVWVANRMPDSVRLPEFFQLFSRKPECVVAEIPYGQTVSAKWKGEWIMDDPRVRDRLKQSLQPLLHCIVAQSSARKSLRTIAKSWLANKWGIDYNNNKS